MASFTHQIGNWNPQLLREWRGRLKPRSVIATVGLSLLGQVLLWLSFSQSTWLNPTEQWLGIFRVLTWTMPYVLFVVGAYFLMTDLLQEEKRGTLNFIRSSPRPSRDILIGKLLGVPSLAYLAVITAVPLHLGAALQSQAIPLLFCLSFYVLLVAGTLFFFSLAMLMALLSGSSAMPAGQQSISAFAFTALMLIALTPMFMAWNFTVTWQPFQFAETLGWGTNDGGPIWVYLPISKHLLLSHGFTLGQLAIGTMLMGWILQRRFRIPGGTILSKQQSYTLVAYAQILVVGFFLQSEPSEDFLAVGAVTLYVINFSLFLGLIFALSPQRQALLDWARYPYRKQGRWTALIWADRAPAPVAIAVNLVIALAVVGPWLFLNGIVPSGFVVLILLSLGGILLIYAVLVQRFFASTLRNPITWAAITVGLLMSILPIILGIFQVWNSPASIFVWTFLGYGMQDIDNDIMLGATVAGILLQWVVLAVLGRQLNRHLKKLAAPKT